MRETFPWLCALATGLVINAVDVACTLLFAVKPWEAELRRQGLAPSKLTPPYYIAANFIGGLVLSFVYWHLRATLGPGASTAALASSARSDNAVSAEAHRALGFADVGLVRCFRKELG